MNLELQLDMPIPVLRSVSEDQDEILQNIRTLHCPEGFECDCTYGNGSFWKSIQRPALCFDVEPLQSHVEQADSMLLPLERESLNNLIFDPPFLTYIRAGRHENGSMVMGKRFGGYWNYTELEDHYRHTISEAYRVLKSKGKLIFKCQDIIHNHKMHCTHINVVNWAENEGFRLRDLFILSAKRRMPSPQKGQQHHARIFHSYFLVLEKLP